MIVPRGSHLWRTLSYLGMPLLGLLAWDIAIVFAYKVLHWQWTGSRHIPLALYGGAIGVVVGFRNNSAYARWWEARALWGQITNSTRSLARQVMTTMSEGSPNTNNRTPVFQREILYLLIAYAHALRQHLRRLPPWELLGSVLTAEEIAGLQTQANVPLALIARVGALLTEARDAGLIDAVTLQLMNSTLNNLTDAQGGTERIKNTPMPDQYDYLPKLFVQMYCILLPIGLVETLGWFTPLGSTLVGFIFLALAQTGRDLENPFENTMHDLPLTSLSTNIETNLRQLLGETALPAPIEAVDGVLW